MTKKEKEQYLNQKEILGIAPYRYEVLDIVCKNNIWKIILRWENTIKEKMIYFNKKYDRFGYYKDYDINVTLENRNYNLYAQRINWKINKKDIKYFQAMEYSNKDKLEEDKYYNEKDKMENKSVTFSNASIITCLKDLSIFINYNDGHYVSFNIDDVEEFCEFKSIVNQLNKECSIKTFIDFGTYQNIMIYYEHPTNVLFDGRIRIDKENLKLNKIKIN